MIRFFCILLCFFIGIQISVYSQEDNNWAQKMIDAQKIGDNNKVYKWSLIGAEKGDKIAQFVVAMCYLNSKGVEKDLEKVKFWATKSAEQGYDYAQCMLGDLYFYEYNDKDKALYWLKLSASKKNIHAMKRLSEILLNDTDTEIEEGFKWLKETALCGDIDAINEVADSFFDGTNGQKIDYSEAFKWFNKSALLNNTYGLYNAAMMLKEGKGVVSNLEKSYELLSKAASMKCAPAYTQLAYFYAEGILVPKNFDLAIEMIDEAIKLSSSTNYIINCLDSKGEILLMQNKKDEAVLIWNKMKNEFPNQIKEMSDTPFITSIKSITNER